jgi:short-subunit dehydrogenase
MEMRDVRNRVVVITGASSGFGRGAAEKFARNGAHVVLAARRGNLIERLANRLQKKGVRALAVETDVSDRGQVENLAERALREFGRIDVWINNAGVATYGRFNDSPIEEHEQVIKTNLLGPMYGSRVALEQFRRQGHGVLINVGSFAGVASFPYGASYTASKHAIRGFGTALRQELEANNESANIHVCTVEPTSMDTPFFEHAANHTGHAVRPIPPVYDPQLVIDAIYEITLNPKPEAVVGSRGKVGAVVGKVAPRVMEKQMAHRTHSAMMENNEWASDSPGNLFAPMLSGAGVRGGWTGKSTGGKVANTLVSLGVSAAAGWGLWKWSQQESSRRRPRAAA